MYNSSWLFPDRVNIAGKRDAPIGGDRKAALCEQRLNCGQQIIAMDLGGDHTNDREMRFRNSLQNGQFIALDARDGKLLWETNLGPSVSAGPMTYMVNGKQYVTVQCGMALYTFALR